MHYYYLWNFLQEEGVGEEIIDVVHPFPYGMAQLASVILAVSGTAATPSMGSARRSVQRQRISTTGSQQPGRLLRPHPYWREQPLTICSTRTSLQHTVTILLKHFHLPGLWWSILMRQVGSICSNLMSNICCRFLSTLYLLSCLFVKDAGIWLFPLEILVHNLLMVCKQLFINILSPFATYLYIMS